MAEPKDTRFGQSYSLPDLRQVRQIQVGTRLQGGAIVTQNGLLRSEDFDPDTELEGWGIFGSGRAVFVDGVFRGVIIATQLQTGEAPDQRIEITDGEYDTIKFFSGDPDEILEGLINVGIFAAGDPARRGTFIIRPPQVTGETGDQWPGVVLHGPALDGSVRGNAILIVGTDDFVRADHAVAGQRGIWARTVHGNILIDAPEPGAEIQLYAGAGTLRLTGQVVDGENWQAASLVGAWTDYGGLYAPTSYRRRGNGVEVVINVAGPSALPNDIFTLPAGYRPSLGGMAFDCVGDGEIANIEVSTAGAVRCVSVGAGGGTNAVRGTFTIPIS